MAFDWASAVLFGAVRIQLAINGAAAHAEFAGGRRKAIEIGDGHEGKNYTITGPAAVTYEEIAAQIKAKIPLGRFATPEEIASAAAFLAADGDYITGQELNINGGYHM